MYASGLHTDRTLAAWLNVNEQQTSRDRPFSADTVREMLRNSAYAGCVSARRDTSKAIKGQHQTIVDEPLFDRVQAMRGERARTMHPGRPSQRYLLKGLARCERCQGKMQGTAVGRQLAARYYCATRRNAHSCDQPLGSDADDPTAKRQLLALIFERVWLDEQKVVAVRPKPSFVPYFQNPPLETAAKGVCKERERRDSNPRPPT
jgi:hypothetical protein